MPRGARPRSLEAVIISNNPETIDGLENYLRRAGVGTRSTRNLQKALEITTQATGAVILFPDDYHRDRILEALASLNRARPRILRVLVTGTPGLFVSVTVDDETALLVIPKPAWGWTILDNIRSRLNPAFTEGR